MVTQRIKEKAGVKLSARVVLTLAGLSKALEAPERTVRVRKGAKYSRLLLDEAVALMKAKGIKVAVKATGVNKWSIWCHYKKLRGPTGRDGTRYTLASKRALVRLAQQLMSNGHTKVVRGWKGGQRVLPRWGHNDAFEEAGRQLGMNGKSILFQWTQGQFVLDTPSTPLHPPASPAPA